MMLIQKSKDLFHSAYKRRDHEKHGNETATKGERG